MKKRPPASKQTSEYKEYLSKLSPEDRVWVKRFYEDFYNGGVFNEGTVLETTEQIQEATHNFNSINRDAMEVAERKGDLQNLDANTIEFMEEVSDELDWQTLYLQAGYKIAKQAIYEQAERDLKNKYIDVKITLTRFFIKMNSLKRLNWRERKHKRKNKREE